VSDLSPLAGQPLEVLWCFAPNLDLSPIAKAPLQLIRLEFDRDRHGPILRAIPTLKTINDQPAAEVLK